MKDGILLAMVVHCHSQDHEFNVFFRYMQSLRILAWNILGHYSK